MKLSLLKILTVIAVICCLNGCNWPYYTKIISGFSDDSQFDRNADANKITQLSSLYYYWVATSLKLQCLNSSGAWVDVYSASSGPNSTVGTNSDGSLHNFNSIADKPVYQHWWPGLLIQQNVSNCSVRKTLAYETTTNNWIYRHYQKFVTLRAIDSGGYVLPVFSDAERTCFGNDPNSDFWQRFSDCNDKSNDTGSFDQLYDEEVTRISSTTPLNVDLNLLHGAGEDAWLCSYNITVDGVSKGFWGNILNPPTTAHLGNFSYGAHSVGFTVYQCSFISTCSSPASYCKSVNRAWGHANGKITPTYVWALNPAYQGQQLINITLEKPSP